MIHCLAENLLSLYKISVVVESLSMQVVKNWSDLVLANSYFVIVTSLSYCESCRVQGVKKLIQDPISFSIHRFYHINHLNLSNMI